MTARMRLPCTRAIVARVAIGVAAATPEMSAIAPALWGANRLPSADTISSAARPSVASSSFR